MANNSLGSQGANGDVQTVQTEQPPTRDKTESSASPAKIGGEDSNATK